MNKQKINNWKYNILIILATVVCVRLLALNFDAVVAIRTMLINSAISNINSNVVITILKLLTTYLGISYTICSSILIIYITTTNCVRLNEQKKFELEPEHEIDDVLDIYKKEKLVQTDEKVKDSELKKPTYTIEDLKKEKQMLESSLIETVEPKEKQKVLD